MFRSLRAHVPVRMAPCLLGLSFNGGVSRHKGSSSLILASCPEEKRSLLWSGASLFDEALPSPLWRGPSDFRVVTRRWLAKNVLLSSSIANNGGSELERIALRRAANQGYRVANKTRALSSHSSTALPFVFGEGEEKMRNGKMETIEGDEKEKKREEEAKERRRWKGERRRGRLKKEQWLEMDCFDQKPLE